MECSQQRHVGRGWDDDDLHRLTYYRALHFEAVDESVLMIDPTPGRRCSSIGNHYGAC